jgi:hypothetical protein
MKRRPFLARRLGLVAALGAVTAFVACDLNPQPLPPFVPENSATGSSDAGSGFGRKDGSSNGDPAPSQDGGTFPETDDGGDAGPDDAGDAGDAGDADADATT